MRQVRTARESILPMLCITTIAISMLTIPSIFDPAVHAVVRGLLLCIALIPIFLTIISIRKLIAIRQFKKKSVCYEAKVLELIFHGYTFGRSGSGGRNVSSVKCMFEDSNGESRVVTSYNGFVIGGSIYQLGSDGFKKIEIQYNLLAKVYVNCDNPKEFEVELFEL